MEAFDIINVLSRYYGYSPKDSEPAYYLLIQAEALDKSSCPHLTGLMCFYRMYDSKIADQINSKSGTISDLLDAISRGNDCPLPQVIKESISLVWLNKSQ